jgi:hypothetical protein
MKQKRTETVNLLAYIRLIPSEEGAMKRGCYV